MTAAPAIIVFDGACCLCSTLARWVIRSDRHGRFRFASLQSAAGASLLGHHGLDPHDVRTILLVKEGRAYLRSAAVLEIARGLPGWAVLARILSLVPASLRDRIYDFIARNRYRWFGRPDICVLPPAAKPPDKTPAPGP